MNATNSPEIPTREAWLRILRYATPIFLGMVILLGLGIYIWSKGRDPLEIASEKIEVGMPTQEALEIVWRLDVPAGTIGRGKRDQEPPILFQSDQGLLALESMNDRVVKKEYAEFHYESSFVRLRRWLGW